MGVRDQKEKDSHHFDWPLFYNMFKQFLAPRCLITASMELALNPRAREAAKFLDSFLVMYKL